MRRIFTFPTGVIFALFATFTSKAQQAQLLVNENFAGYSAGNLNGKGGWAQLSSSGTTADVVVLSSNVGALTKSGYTSGTNYLNVNNTGRDYAKGFFGNVTPSISNNTTFYMSFVLRVPSASGTSTTGNATGLIGFRTLGGDLTAMLTVGDANSGNNLRFGITTDNSTKVWSNTNFSFNTTYLIVMRYDAVPGSTNDRMHLWINPSSLESEAAMGTPAVSITNGLGYNTNIASIAIIQSSDGADAHIDGIKASYGTGFPSAAQNAAAAWADLSAAGATLPVKFASFEAKPSNGKVNLTWNVGTEDNVAGYEVEKSTDGRGYSKIGYVEAAGVSTYSFTDNKLSDVAYYRIKAVDFDGKLSFSAIATVKGDRSSITLKAYPMPAVNDVTLQHPSAVKESMISISSAEGRVIRQMVPAKGSQQTSINLTSLQPGVYVIRFHDGNGGSESIKVVKQ